MHGLPRRFAPRSDGQSESRSDGQIESRSDKEVPRSDQVKVVAIT